LQACSSTSASCTTPGRNRRLRTLTGLLRAFFSKGTDFSRVADEEVRHTVELICDRPRKVLGYKTANEAFKEMVHSV
jgi:IS30 family transposase